MQNYWVHSDSIVVFYFQKWRIRRFRKYSAMTTTGKIPAKVLPTLQATGRSHFQIGDLSKEFNLSAVQERSLVRRLVRSGEMIRLRRGQYLFRPQNQRSAPWTPTEALALKSLILDSDGQYQLCGQITFQRYGWDDQIPNRVHAYNTLVSGSRTVGAVVLALIKVEASRLGSTEITVTPDGTELIWPTRARALFDAVYDWSRFNSLPRGYDWIRAELKRDGSLAADLVEVTLQFANQGTLRRIGRLLQDVEAPAGLIRKLERRVAPSSSFIAWDPTRPKRGSIDRHWGVVFNHES